MTLLLNEQYHLCCYSEVRADLRGLGYHIEHVENKSQHPERTFDYLNLAASALDSGENGGLSSLKGKMLLAVMPKENKMLWIWQNLSIAIFAIVPVILLTCLMVGSFLLMS